MGFLSKFFFSCTLLGWELNLGEMDKKRVAVPLVCHGHSRPVVDLFYSPVTPDGYFLISASKGLHFHYLHFVYALFAHSDCLLNDQLLSSLTSKRAVKFVVIS